jgi:hypothetical protein
MNNLQDLTRCTDGTTLEYCVLSTFGYRNALDKRFEPTPKLHYCRPGCCGSESPELWTWRTVYEERTLVFDGACVECLNHILRQARTLNIPVYESLSSDRWIPSSQKRRPPRHYNASF